MRSALARPGWILLLGAALHLPATWAGAVTPEENFKWYCVQCHGPEGKGDGINSVDELPVGPMNLTNPEEMKKFSNDQIIQTVTHGGPANTLDSLMPPWGNRLTADEIRDLMRYVRSLCRGDDCPK